MKFDNKGFPDFSPYAKELPNGGKSVTITPGANRNDDFRRADQAAGYKPGERPKDHTWHHHQQEGRMELIPNDLHDEVKHTGGYSIWGAGKKEPELPDGTILW